MVDEARCDSAVHVETDLSKQPILMHPARCKWFHHSFQSENAAVSDPPFSAIARYCDFCGRCCFHMPWCAVSIASWGGRNGRPTNGLMMLRKDIWDCFDLDDGRALKREVSWSKKLLQGIFVLRMVVSVLQSLTILFARWRLCIEFFYAYLPIVRSRCRVWLLSRVQYLSFVTEPQTLN